MTSVCPSDCGWYTELIWSWMPWSLKNSCQKLLMKMGSQSLTIYLGIPCSWTTCSTNCSATLLAEYGHANAVKWAYLVKRSTIHNGVFFRQSKEGHQWSPLSTIHKPIPSLSRSLSLSLGRHAASPSQKRSFRLPATKAAYVLGIGFVFLAFGRSGGASLLDWTCSKPTILIPRLLLNF
jgi:hypothetical protein